MDSAFEVMVQLRPHLEPEAFLRAVRRMEDQGYRLAILEVGGAVCAVAGYRIIEMLRTGRVLEVDDLVTDEAARSRGHGRFLHDWLVEEAARQGCSAVELDSALHRSDAHRFYFRQRMSALAFHFALAIPDTSADDQDRPR